jgi:anti-sigma regulatory factor (Ser/Thr protein kinase)
VRTDLRGVSAVVADDVVLALHEVATNAVLHGSSGGQPIQVVVHVNEDWVEAPVLDNGPSPRPVSQPRPTPTSCGLAVGACGCWGGWSMRSALNASGSAPG